MKHAPKRMQEDVRQRALKLEIVRILHAKIIHVAISGKEDPQQCLNAVCDMCGLPNLAMVSRSPELIFGHEECSIIWDKQEIKLDTAIAQPLFGLIRVLMYCA